MSYAKRFVRYALAAALSTIFGCSLSIGVSDLDSGCGLGQKLCGTGNCVAQSDPAYGCRSVGCDPCSLTNAIPTCLRERCIVKTCLFPFGCQNDAGCAANLLVESDNCGVCGNVCGAEQTCRDGECMTHVRLGQ